MSHASVCGAQTRNDSAGLNLVHVDDVLGLKAGMRLLVNPWDDEWWHGSIRRTERQGTKHAGVWFQVDFDDGGLNGEWNGKWVGMKKEIWNFETYANQGRLRYEVDTDPTH